MAKYDVESFVDDLQTFLQANLNTKLLALDSEKNDSITLEPIVSAAYLFQVLTTKVANYDQFLFIHIESMGGGQNLFSAVDKTFIVEVMIVVSDNGNDLAMMRRMLRYQRALIELFESNYANVSKLGAIKVKGLAPFPIEGIANRPNVSQVVGVSLEVHIP